MGRGGKKKNKKEADEDLGIGSLTITDSEPSTSNQPVAPPEAATPQAAQPPQAAEPPQVSAMDEDDGLGLGLGGGGRKKNKKKAPTVEAPSEAEASPHAVASPEAVAPPKTLAPPQAAAEEEDGGGLGLGGGGRKRNKKKSAAAKSAAEPPKSGQGDVPQAAPAVTTVAGVSSETAPISVPQRAPPSVQGLGSGRGRGSVGPAVPGQPASAGPFHPPTLTGPVGQTAPAGPFGRPTSSGPPAWSQPPQVPQQQVFQPPPSQSRPPQAQAPAASSAPTQQVAAKPSSDVVCRFKIPDKIMGGTVPAIKIKVLTNYLEMTIKPMQIHRYDVNIKPDRPRKLISKAFDLAKQKYFPKHVTGFDQRKNCYSLQLLGRSITERLDTKVELLDDNGAKMTFELSFKHTGIVNLKTIIDHMKNGGSSLNTPMEAIQCVDVILQQGTINKYVKAGKQYFRRPGQPIDLGQGLEMWTGLFQSAIFTSRAFINVDVAHKGFPRQQPLIDALKIDFRLDPTRPLDRQRGSEDFKLFLKGLRVTALIGGDSRSGKKREFICNGLVDAPNRLTFNMTDASGRTQKMTVEKYFEVEKKYRLKYPNLNCLWVGPKDKNIYYPMELLEIVYGQALAKQLTDRQQPVMVREAATPPHIRMQKIYEVIKDMNYSQSPQFKQFGLEIGNQFTTVDAKILQPPKLNVGGAHPVEPRRGVWQAPGFLKAEPLQSWGIIVVEADANACRCQQVIDLIMGVGRKVGMAANPPKYTNFNVRMFELQKTLYSAIENKVTFLFIIVSGRERDCYHKVKRMAELEVGILTQCIKENTAARRMNEQTMRNILLKVNSKLMGINQALDARSMPNCLRDGGVMVVGADVTHPSPDQSNIPSIAAITASIDAKCFMYNIEMSIQTPKKEMIMQFEDMMVDHLKVYKQRQNSLPRKIYVFRDGVSEGQFAQVMNSEIVALQRAYARMAGPNARPEILFLLVQKRHHTRLFTTDRSPQNVEPGTVVDTQIVHPREMDFYLVSHQAIKGTARPTRYHAVCNDGGVPVDEVEQLAYYLCHLYSRCSRSVSYPTPTYYAHLACFRARSLTYGDQFNNDDLEKNPRRLRVMDRILQCSRMFFV